MKENPFRFLVSFCLLLLAGCSSFDERRAVFANLSPEPIAATTWRKMTGTYAGPIRSMSSRFGTTGTAVDNVRLELGGTPEAPLVFLRMRMVYSSADIAYGERMESFTNIPECEFGTKGRLVVSSHAPNQLYIGLRPEIFSPNRGTAMIVTFHGSAGAEVDFVGHFRRRGIGTLYRVPFSETGR